ncbi:hypothetical protein [Luteibacter yeojuensis]|uniref:hypothetical protein n=1 Tax=Luteibacter yeojuensis TaxID=345309 RepID=UPI003083FDF7
MSLTIRRRRDPLRAACRGFAAFLCASAAEAQNATPEEEYRKYLRVETGLAPLGENAFGEEIALYSGALAFRQVDISLPGNGPTIEVARRFAFNERGTRLDLIGRAFGDWELDLPSITTSTANQQNVRGWAVDGAQPGAICSSFGPPPLVRSPPGDPMRHGWEVAAWWSGHQLHMPGEGDQDLLRRVPGNPAAPTYGGLLYPIVTRGNWAVGCLAQASNDASVQAFLAIAPDGTRYRLDHLAYRWMPNIERPLGTGGTRHAPQTDVLQRREGRMLPTRVEDRFGNWIQYHYNGDLVTDITASDGRHVAIGYEAGTSRIAAVTVMPGNALARTWRYQYAPLPRGATLAGITLPDGASWQFNLASFSSDARIAISGSGTCNRLANADNAGTVYTGSMVHPSRLSAEFTVTPVRRGRSGLYRTCWAAPSINPLPDAPGTFAFQPNAWWSMALVSRRYWGAGMDERRWVYAYSPSNESWRQDCPGAWSPKSSVDTCGRVPNVATSGAASTRSTQAWHIWIAEAGSFCSSSCSACSCTAPRAPTRKSSRITSPTSRVRRWTRPMPRERRRSSRPIHRSARECWALPSEATSVTQATCTKKTSTAWCTCRPAITTPISAAFSQSIR